MQAATLHAVSQSPSPGQPGWHPDAQFKDEGVGVEDEADSQQDIKPQSEPQKYELLSELQAKHVPHALLLEHIPPSQFSLDAYECLLFS